MADAGEDEITDQSDNPVSVSLEPEKRSRRRWCGGCVVIFLVLCGLAALGNYFVIQAFKSHVAQRDAALEKERRRQNLEATGPEHLPHDLPKDMDGVLKVLEPEMHKRFRYVFDNRNLVWPPRQLRLIGLKTERKLEMWAANEDGEFHLLKIYPVLAASGSLGPKRRQGDKQVPEGYYRLVYLNPASSFHLSLLLDYPNDNDILREGASVELADLGDDICVHGSNVSIGCLAVGDAAIEEIFTLAALADYDKRDILIFPADFRVRPDLLNLAGDKKDLMSLYADLAKLGETVTPKK